MQSITRAAPGSGTFRSRLTRYSLVCPIRHKRVPALSTLRETLVLSCRAANLSDRAHSRRYTMKKLSTMVASITMLVAFALPAVAGISTYPPRVSETAIANTDNVYGAFDGQAPTYATGLNE